MRFGKNETNKYIFIKKIANCDLKQRRYASIISFHHCQTGQKLNQLNKLSSSRVH
jgi:hypothetical protein